MNGKSPKILYVASTFSHLAAFHRPYLAWFAGQGCVVHAAAGGEPLPLEGVSRSFTLPFEKKMFSPKNLAATRQLADLLREERYDLVSLHTSLAAFFARLAVGRAGKGECMVLNTVHGYLFDESTPFPKRQLLLGAERLTAGSTDVLLTMNEADQAIAETHRLGRTILPTAGMGVDLSRFQPPLPGQREAARRALGLPADALVLVYAAEFSHRKNQAMLLRALPHLPPETRLLLPGRGETLEACKALAAQLGVADRAIFPGFVEDMARCYHAADLCTPSSRSEGLPFNVVEAMSCGLPVLATDVKGHRDLVLPGRTGALYPYDDAHRFAQAVQALADAETRAAMGRAARERARDYGLERVFPQLTSLYAQTLPGRIAAPV